MTHMRVLRSGDYSRTHWKNDGGWTTEIARSDNEASGDFRWRVSIAEIETDGPFSSFPGVTRDLLLLEDNGIELDIDDNAPLRLSARFERAHFEGESRVQCHLLAGATRDFNVMARRDAVRAEIVARPLVGSMMVFSEPGVEWLVHVLAGHTNARSAGQELVLETGSSLHIDFRGSDSGRVVLDGAGELMLVKFTRIGER
jgi:environmental stress-induced protein Ves